MRRRTALPSTTGYDLAVIGGGLVGAAIAWGAARTGAKTILLDEGDVALRASRGNFGLIWLQGKGSGAPAYRHWSHRAGQLWQHFTTLLEDACGFDIGFRASGGLHFCFSEVELEQRAAMVAQARAENSASAIEMLDRGNLKRWLPQIGEHVVGASFAPTDAQVNPLLLLRALHVGLQEQGGVYRPGFCVTQIEPRGTGFALHAGADNIGAARVAIAAGLGAAALAPQVGLALPLRAERGQIVVTERLKPFFPYAANCLRQTVEGTCLFGSSHENAGFDTGTDVATAARLAARAIRVFPALADAAVVRMWAALRILTPDGLPVYERSRRHPGAFAITCHSGVTLASVHALDLGPAIAGGTLPPGLESFGSDRFDVQAH